MVKYTAPLRVPSDLGVALQQARLARGLTQTQVAEQLGVQQSTVSEMETGAATIYVRRLLELADAVGLELSGSWEARDASGG